MSYREPGKRLCDTCNGVLRWMEPTCSNCIHEKLHALEQGRAEMNQRVNQLNEFMQRAMWVRT